MGVIAKGILRGCQGVFTPVSLRYPLSVFNKNSTLNKARVYSPPCPWDTHYQFSIKTLLSNTFKLKKKNDMFKPSAC